MSEDDRILSLAVEGCRFEFDRENGSFSIVSDERPVFSGASGEVLTRNDKEIVSLSSKGSWEVDRSSESELLLVKKEQWGSLLYRASCLKGVLLLEVGLTWEDSREPPAIEAMVPLDVPPGGVWPGKAKPRSWRFYQHGWQCWSASGVVKSRRPGDYLYTLFLPRSLKAMVANTATTISSQRGRFESEWFGAIGDLDAGDSVVVGFTGISRALSQVSVMLARKQSESELAAAARFEGKKCERNKEFFSEPLAVIPGDLSGRNLETYAELLADGCGVGELRRSPAGWCSWYQYFADVKKEDVQSNLEAITGKYESLGLELVQVDDGYQKDLGEWLDVNEKFPGGMKKVADEIASRGKMPGIWIAPFTVTRRSKKFKEKREWLIRDKRGKPVLAGVNPLWKGRFYGLDITNPEVLAWLRELFTTIREDGYRFVKLDFLATGLLEGKHHDPTVTRAEAVRNALKVIREALGDDTYIIAAGGPILMGTGIFDTQRIGGDVAPYWKMFGQTLLRDRSTPGARNCLVSVFTRGFLHGRLWEADPDCLLIRGKDTKLSLAERQTLSSAVSVLGGAFIISDDMGLWGDEEEDLARRVLPTIEVRPRCPDLWKREIPRLLVASLDDPGGQYFLVWAINWSRYSRTTEITLEELGLDPARYHASEFWTGKYLGVVGYSFAIKDVPGHGSAVVRLTPAGDQTRVVGSNIHVSQGAAEIESLDVTGDRISLTVTSPAKCRASLMIHVPADGSERVKTEDADVLLERLTKAVYRISFELDRSRQVNLRVV